MMRKRSQITKKNGNLVKHRRSANKAQRKSPVAPSVDTTPIKKPIHKERNGDDNYRMDQ